MFVDIEEITPYLAMLGQTLIDLDEDKDEADDFSGHLLLYASEVIDSVLLGQEDLPELPELLAEGFNERITGVSRITLILARNALGLARFQTKGDVRRALTWVYQSLGLLLANKPIPTFQGSLTFAEA